MNKQSYHPGHRPTLRSELRYRWDRARLFAEKYAVRVVALVTLIIAMLAVTLGAINPALIIHAFESPSKSAPKLEKSLLEAPPSVPAVAKPPPASATPIARTEIITYISNTKIIANSRLDKSMFSERVRYDSVPDGSITDLSALDGKFASSDIPAGSTMLQRHVVDKPIEGPPEQGRDTYEVAVSLRGLEGLEIYVQPGTLVDIIQIIKTQEFGTQVSVLVPRARVISVGGSRKQKLKTGGETVEIPYTATLEAPNRLALQLEGLKSRLEGRDYSLSFVSPMETAGSSVSDYNSEKLKEWIAEVSGVKKRPKGLAWTSDRQFVTDPEGKFIEVK